MAPDIEQATKTYSSEIAPRWQLAIPVLTIAGPSGVGKTSVSKQLGELYGITPVKLGDRIREEAAQNGIQILDYVDRPPKDDQARDELVKRIITESIQTSVPTIIEARLSGWIGRMVEAENDIDGKVLTVLLTTIDQDVRFQRIAGRERNALGDTPLDVPTARRLTRSREQGDWQAWRRASPDLSYLNPTCPDDDLWIYNPKNPNGLYDIVIATDNMSVKEVSATIHQQLLARGLVQRVG